MSLIRLVVAWLLIAALPLHGFAASTMLLCVPVAASAGAAHGEHAAHGHHHAYGDAERASAQPSSDSAQQAHSAVPGTDKVAKADKGHACGSCSSCCHVLALTHSPSPMPSADSPSAELPQSHVRVSTRASPRPDKPPRA